MTLRYHLLQHEGGDKVLKNLYVDNIMETSDNETQLIERCKSTQAIFKSGSFDLHEYYSNSKIVRDTLTPNTSEDYTSIYGHTWNFTTDEMKLIWSKNPKHTKVTKRTILSFIGSIYDPEGFFAPSTLLYKRLVRTLWIEKWDWNTPLSMSLHKQWCQLLPNTEICKTIPRYIINNSMKASLVLFCDASELALGIAAYFINLQLKTSSLIMGKSRLLPLDKTKGQKLTIPRKELIAILATVRLANFIRKEVENIDDITIFSDSQVALQQLEKTEDKSIFVRNRVSEIAESQSHIEFRYVSTAENP